MIGAEFLAGAARFEADRRRRSFPRLIRGGESAEALTLNYQAWCALAEWLETGSCRFLNTWGGVADPPRTAIDWPLLEEAAAKELKAIEERLLSSPADEDLLRRRDAVASIHLRVSSHRHAVDETTRILRADAQLRLEREVA